MNERVLSTASILNPLSKSKGAKYYPSGEAFERLIYAGNGPEYVTAVLYLIDRKMPPASVFVEVLRAFKSVAAVNGREFVYPYAYASLLSAWGAQRFLLPGYQLLPTLQQLWYFIESGQGRTQQLYALSIEPGTEMRPEGWLERGSPADLGKFVASYLRLIADGKSRSLIDERLRHSVLRGPGLFGFSFSVLLEAMMLAHSGFRDVEGETLLLPALIAAYMGIDDSDELKGSGELLKSAPSVEEGRTTDRRSPAKGAIAETDVLMLERLVRSRSDAELFASLSEWIRAGRNLFEIMDALKLIQAQFIIELPHDAWLSLLEGFNFLSAVDEHMERAGSRKEQIEALYMAALFLKRSAEKQKSVVARTDAMPSALDRGTLADRLMLALEGEDADTALATAKTIARTTGWDRRLMDKLLLFVSRNNPRLYSGVDLRFVISAIRAAHLSGSTLEHRYFLAVVRFLVESERDWALFHQFRNTQHVRIWDEHAKGLQYTVYKA